MELKIIDKFEEALSKMPQNSKVNVTSDEEMCQAYMEINKNMAEYRREFCKKEKESRVAAAEILINS